MKRHMALVAVAKVRPHICRPLVCLSQHHPSGVAFVNRGANRLDHCVRFREVFAAGAVSLDEIGDCVNPQSIHTHIEP